MDSGNYGEMIARIQVVWQLAATLPSSKQSYNPIKTSITILKLPKSNNRLRPLVEQSRFQIQLVNVCIKMLTEYNGQNDYFIEIAISTCEPNLYVNGE